LLGYNSCDAPFCALTNQKARVNLIRRRASSVVITRTGEAPAQSTALSKASIRESSADGFPKAARLFLKKRPAADLS